jgi:uncharacterized membrane protein YhaH (DUF805 family)
MNWYLEVFKKYAVFSGRARRKEYWMFVLFNQIILFVLGFVTVLLGAPSLVYLYTFAVLIPSIAVGVRRMHDINHSGWWLLFPIVNLVFACTEGTRGENKFGSDPKENTGSFDQTVIKSGEDGYCSPTFGGGHRNKESWRKSEGCATPGYCKHSANAPRRRSSASVASARALPRSSLSNKGRAFLYIGIVLAVFACAQIAVQIGFETLYKMCPNEYDLMVSISMPFGIFVALLGLAMRNKSFSTVVAAVASGLFAFTQMARLFMEFSMAPPVPRPWPDALDIMGTIAAIALCALMLALAVIASRGDESDDQNS